ncbi:ABC transporter permease [Sutcliffiella rhizosphaerae]|uniref:Multidrug ABC transporter permease YbhR n=1 Tax=Sutcliffiella rhizosphaerae TaxID=2880967 RepID=A0ABM8YJL1_9BACI|nr:ABC transporter permease [Sutcliffiella rhizosphaerae]CAG9620045.1 putative multidrug ABC transporter permease YbhR [Sutcliffiella rhizosphaerae]
MRILAVVNRILRQFFRDKRTLALMILAPLLILTLLHVVFSNQEKVPTIGLVEPDNNFAEKLATLDTELVLLNEEQEGWDMIKQGELDAFYTPGRLVLEGSDPATNRAVIQVLNSIQMPMQVVEPGSKFDLVYAYGSEELELFDNIGPFLIVFFVFFFVFLIAGVSFLRERTTGTLERLMATPIKRWELVLGYMGGFGLFTLVQSSLIVWFAIYILDINMAGGFGTVMFVTFTVAITALSLGTLLSAFARTELQMIQFIPLVVVPQVFFSGLFPIEAMPNWLQKISLIMPLTYAGEAMKDIMIRGKGLQDISVNLLILLAFSLLFIMLNIRALKKYRPT